MHVKVNDNIILVGTAHISKDSVDEVREVIEKYKPKIVAIELCKRRHESITKKDQWENTPINQLLKSGNAYLMLAQTFLASIQRKLGKEHGVEPGSEMIAAMQEAEKHKIDVALVDRDISVTLKRAWRRMGIREKTRLTWEFLKAIVGYDEEELEELDLKELMNQDVISAMMEEFKEIAPSVTNVLITERDQYISKKIKEESKKGLVVAVVGAGHLKGIQQHLKEDNFDEIDLEKLEYVPQKRVSILKIVGYAIPVVFAAIIVYIYYMGGIEQAGNALLWWILINGSLSAIFTAIARGHPYSIITAFFAAPITSLNPAIAAGWVAGYVEFKMRKPVVKDFKELSKIESIREFLNNRVIRLMMVVAFANLGSMLGTIIALPILVNMGLGV